jgi:hypothetical protein
MASSKVEGYTLNLPGAPDSWHLVEGLGYLHPSIPVPVDSNRAQAFYDAKKQEAADAEQAWDEFEQFQEERGNRLNGRLPFEKPEPPVKRVRVTESELNKGERARQEHVNTARAVPRLINTGSPDEQVQAHEEAAALAAEEG